MELNYKVKLKFVGLLDILSSSNYFVKIALIVAMKLVFLFVALCEMENLNVLSPY